jgi:hypothetical protein
MVIHSKEVALKMENLYGFPPNQTWFFINNLFANLPFFISLGLAALVGIRSLREKSGKKVVLLKRSEKLAEAA